MLSFLFGLCSSCPNLSLLLNFSNFSSFIFHLSCFFACLFHVSSFFRSFPLDSSDSSGFRNSLMSSSHLSRGLPTDLFLLMWLSRPGFQSIIFYDHRSSGRVAMINAILHFILRFLYPAWNRRPVHLIVRFFCTSLEVFDVSFFFNFLFKQLLFLFSSRKRRCLGHSPSLSLILLLFLRL